MGNQASDIAGAIDQVEGELNEPQIGTGVKLYKFVRAAKGGQWEKLTDNCNPSFYDVNEETGKKDSDWHLEVESEDLDCRVDDALGYILDLAGRRVTFQAAETCWALKFSSAEDFRSFGEELNDKAFFNIYGVENDEKHRSKQLGDDYASMFFTTTPQVEPMDLSVDDEEGDNDEKSPIGFRENTAKTTEDDISSIVVGAMENNFLFRAGGQVDVLRNVVGGGLEDKDISFSLSPFGGKKGRGADSPMMTPGKVLLTQGERKMMILTPEHRSALKFADIETSKVVSTWSFMKDGTDVPMDEITHDNKAAGTEDRSTFLGLAQNRLCRWDLRDSKGVVTESPVVDYNGGKDYARNTNFSCMATSGDGYVVVGATDGKIRLYNDKSLTQAKTAIPGMGAAITAIDVTYDGKWVVATTDHYLMVVKTSYTDDKGRASSAFTSRMGSRGCVPRLLRLRPEDNARTAGKKFSKGKFTWVTESGSSERYIAASCGRYMVVWNFKRVKTVTADSVSFGGLPTSTDYVIHEKEEDVVDSAFLHGKYTPVAATRSPGQFGGPSMVVATPHRLFNVS